MLSLFLFNDLDFVCDVIKPFQRPLTLSSQLVRDCEVVEAFPYDTAPRYLLRDRDGKYGA